MNNAKSEGTQTQIDRKKIEEIIRCFEMHLLRDGKTELEPCFYMMSYVDPKSPKSTWLENSCTPEVFAKQILAVLNFTDNPQSFADKLSRLKAVQKAMQNLFHSIEELTEKDIEMIECEFDSSANAKCLEGFSFGSLSSQMSHAERTLEALGCKMKKARPVKSWVEKNVGHVP